MSALCLLAMDLLLGGAFLLRGIMCLADGRRDVESLPGLPRSFPAGAMGLLWLLMLYTAYLSLMRRGAWSLLLPGRVLSRWLYCWLLWAWPSRSPMQRGFHRHTFLLASLFCLLALLPFASLPLLCGVVAAGIGGLLLALGRKRTLGGLDEIAYAAAAGWGQALFLWGWLAG